MNKCYCNKLKHMKPRWGAMGAGRGEGELGEGAGEGGSRQHVSCCFTYMVTFTLQSHIHCTDS
jgi:hypothetical protein